MKIDEIFTRAKAYIMEHGNYSPTMLVELAMGGIILIHFADFPYETTLEKMKVMFGPGRKCAQDYPGDEVRQVCFLTECWMSKDTSYSAPSKDPHRKEAIAAWLLDVDNKTVSYSGYMAEIVRAGGTIDLLDDYRKIDVDYNKPLMAFLAGFASGGMSDVQLTHLMEKLK